MKRVSAVMALCLVSVAGQAAEFPQGSDRDNRIQFVNYNSADVVVVHAKVGYISRIVLGKNERISPKHTGSGFPQGWDLSAVDNILYLKPHSIDLGNDQPPEAPTAEKWNTNIAITTEEQKLYEVEVRLIDNENDGVEQAFYRVEYRYPVEEAEQRQVVMEKRAASKRKQVKAPPANWDYSMIVGKRSNSIVPTMAYDDGTFTYLRFPHHREVPAVFIQNADGTESKVNTHTDPELPDIVAVHRVTEQLILRLGKNAVAVLNNSFDPFGASTTSGTTVPGMKRVITGATQ